MLDILAYAYYIVKEMFRIKFGILAIRNTINWLYTYHSVQS